MLRLKTPLGMYILSNAVKVDVFEIKQEGSWCVYLIIDSHRQILQEFKSQIDAFFFSSFIRDEVYSMLSVNPKDYDMEWNISKICDLARNEMQKNENKKILSDLKEKKESK